MYTVDQLKTMQPEKGFFVGVDSDGCVFDSMEIKHKECFCPQFVNHFEMQAVSKYAREAWEFVNLYSKTRGCNRFLAVGHALDLLSNRQDVAARDITPPGMKGLRDWVTRETRLGNPALEKEVERTGDPDLVRALAWSREVNDAVKKIVRNVPPFPLVRESLESMTARADVIVVSQTPSEALVREWREHSLDRYVRIIAGQELGPKTEHLSLAAKGKYAPEKTLVIGDAPGDYKAARSNETLFYPIIPGQEEKSWQRFFEESIGRFFGGAFAGDYQKTLLEEFDRHLPETPSWEM